jgi:photosystem II stability/assembly factor-like uncharacterized protein
MMSAVKRSCLACLILLAACSGQKSPARAGASPSPSLPQVPAGSTHVANLRFPDPLHGWALVNECGEADCEALVYATSDGGRSWRRQGSIGDGNEYGGLEVSGHSVFVYGVNLLVSRDGGRTFSAEHLAEIRTRAVAAVGASVWRIDDGDLCAYGKSPCGGGLLLSEDSGRTFKRASAEPTQVDHVTQLLRATKTRAWVVSATGNDRSAAIQTTSDGARTWKSLKNPCAGSKYGADVTLSAIDSQDVWLACGTKAGTKPQHTITLRSHDGGVHWAVPYPAPETGGSYSFAVAAPDIAWLSMAASPVGASEDDGMTWGTRLNYQDNTKWGPVVFVDAHHGWIVYGDLVFRTTDAGHHWQHVRLG